MLKPWFLQGRFAKNEVDTPLESDRLGVRFMAEAGYDPQALMRVIQILEQAGGGRQPEFFSTHPNPENHISLQEWGTAISMKIGLCSQLTQSSQIFLGFTLRKL